MFLKYPGESLLEWDATSPADTDTPYMNHTRNKHTMSVSGVGRECLI